MEINNYLKKTIEDNTEYKLSIEEEKTIKHEGIRKFIFNKLNSTKYKASAISKDYKSKVIQKIDLCVNHELPIHLTIPFGATKNPYLPTAPGIDWAEVFGLNIVRDYLKPIAKAYKYGVVLDFISVAVFEEKVNRIPKFDTDTYDKEFDNLVRTYNKILPRNLKFRFSRVSDTIPKEKIEKLVAIKMATLKKEWLKQSKEVRDYKLLRAKRNSLYNPNDPHLDNLILDSALGHDAFCSECWTTDAAPWDKKDMITLGYTYTPGWAIHIRSTSNSTVNFWSGIGLLQEKGENYIPTVLSPIQFKACKKDIKELQVECFDKDFSNLQKIMTFK